MKQLLAFVVLLVAASAFGANPDYKSFRGIGGIGITTNPPNGLIIIDGSSIESPTGGVSAATATNIAQYYVTNSTGKPPAPLSAVLFNSNGVMQGSAEVLYTNGSIYVHAIPTNGTGSPKLFIKAGGPSGNDSGYAIVAQGGGDASDGVLAVRRHGDLIVPTLITTFGAYYTRANVFIGGNFTATINDAGRVSVSDWGTGLIGSPYGSMQSMIHIQSDIAGPSMIMRPSSAANTYNLQVLDLDYNTVFSIEADGGLSWGGTTNAGGLAVARTSIDTQLTRRRAGSLQMGFTNSSTPQFFGARGITTGWTNNAIASDFTIHGGQSTGNTNGGSIFLNTTPAGASGSTTNPFVTAMTVAGSGLVGVGITAPDAKFHAYGAISNQGVVKIGRLATASGSQSLLLLADTSYPTINFWDGTAVESIYLDSADHSMNFLGRNSFDTVFSTGNAERMRIKSGGNVGIGTASASSSLDVTGQVRAASSIFTNSITTEGTITANQLSAVVIKASGSAGLANVYATNFIYAPTNTGPTTVTTNLFAAGTRYTNDNRRAFVTASVQLSAAAAGTAKMTLYVENAGSATNRATVSAGPLASLITVEQLMLPVGPSMIYYFTDETSGVGATASIVANTCSIIGF